MEAGQIGRSRDDREACRETAAGLKDPLYILGAGVMVEGDGRGGELDGAGIGSVAVVGEQHSAFAHENLAQARALAPYQGTGHALGRMDCWRSFRFWHSYAHSLPKKRASMRGLFGFVVRIYHVPTWGPKYSVDLYAVPDTASA